MLYKIAHFLRDQMPWLWDLVDIVNSFLVRIRYGDKLDLVENVICSKDYFKCKSSDNFYVVPIRSVNSDDLVEFFACQPTESFRFFKPHGFDIKSIKKLQKNRAFLGYVVKDITKDKIAGLGTTMNLLLNKVGFGIGLRLFETVSKDNVASYRSAISASSFRVIEELPYNELYLEIINDMKQNDNINKNLIGGGKSQVVILQPLFVADNMQERRAA